MQYALVNGMKMEPFPKGKGLCPLCNSSVISKCGIQYVHHWSHTPRKDCDPWWENETEWHRSWKGCFPEECREVSFISDSGEIHRADIQSQSGIIVELQHSSISENEKESRDSFYRNIIWIIDGRSFEKTFSILHKLPDPQREFAKDIAWIRAKNNDLGKKFGLYYRVSETKEYFPEYTKSNHNMKVFHQLHIADEIADQISSNYIGHHQYEWSRARKIWLKSNTPIYIDFGDDYLVKLDVYDETTLPCILIVSKVKFIYDVNNVKSAEEVCKHFYNYCNKNMSQSVNNIIQQLENNDYTSVIRQIR